MDELARALGPAFAAGFAIERLLEILDPLLKELPGLEKPKSKKIVLGLVSLAVGLLLAWLAGIRVLQPLGVTTVGVVDIIATGLIVSAGTEGLNSIMKFIEYGKEGTKAKTEDAIERDIQAGLTEDTLTKAYKPKIEEHNEEIERAKAGGWLKKLRTQLRLSRLIFMEPVEETKNGSGGKSKGAGANP